MNECAKCIAAQDRRDPLGARYRAMMRIYAAAAAKHEPLWTLPDDGSIPKQVCIDCPACGGHWLVDEGERWCWRCRWELAQVENHVGPPVETGFHVGEIVRAKGSFTVGRVHYIHPDGSVDVLSAGWTMRLQPEELERVEEDA